MYTVPIYIVFFTLLYIAFVIHGRVYESDGIEFRRQITFESNMKFIEEHNAHADEHGYTVKMNKFGDLVSLFNIAL